MAAAGIAAMTGLIHLVPGAPHIGNVSMLYLLVVILAALRFGRGPAVLASVIAFLAFDWFFVQPRYMFTVRQLSEWLALIMFLITAMVTGQLTALLQARAEEARQSEREAAVLAETSRAAEKRIASILESITDAFVSLDKEWRYTYLNRAAEQFFARVMQKTRDDLIGRKIWEVFPDVVGSRLRREYRRAVAEQATVEFEQYLPPLDTWFESRAYPSEDGLSVYFRDITQRKRAEERLRARERQQAAVAALGQQALAGTDLASLMDQAAALVARTLQVEYGNILELLPDGNALLLRAGVGWKEGSVGHATVDARANSPASYTLLSNIPVIVEDLQTETRFGTPPLLLEHEVVSGLNVIIAGGQHPFGVLGAHTARRRTFTQDDVHFLQAVANVLALAVERNRAEEEARRRERETAALAAASWAVASQIDRDQALNKVLRQLMDVIGPEEAAIIIRGERSAPEAVAWCWNGVGELHVAPDGRVNPALELVLEQGRPIAWGEDVPETRLAIKETSGAVYLPLTMEQQVLGVLYLQLREDQIVSPAERRAVESLANHAAVVLERDRLARAETQARALAEADHLKTTLLSMVSHDFCTPLASIKTGVTALLHEGMPWDAASQRELLLEMNQGVDRLSRMIGNILSLSRLEADAWRPQCEAIELSEVIGAALDSFSADDNRRIRVTLDPILREVWLDPVQMVEVLYNLVDNALKYSRQDCEVEVRASQEGKTVFLEVLDRGPGLPEGEEDRLFDRFYRGPGLQESASSGIGIGLTVCRGLVEAHGGQLAASNREGGGAIFRITLPGSLHPEMGQETDA
jgi:PAS domain S-box-containing protein